jgi:TIR domain/GRAM domain
MSRIFISYSSKNRAPVEALANDLETLGHEIWFDKELAGGQSWWDEILQGIRNCDLFVFALTPQSLDSHPCSLEHAYAMALNKHALPVQLLATSTNLLPPWLSTLQIVDYRQRDANAVLKLSRAFATLPAPKPLPDPLPTPPDVPLSPLGMLMTQIDSPELTLEQQMGLFIQLKGYLGNPDLAADARSLLIRLSEHPRLLAPVFKEIQSTLALPTVNRGTQSTAKPKGTAASAKRGADTQNEEENSSVSFDLEPGEQLLNEFSAGLYLNAMSAAQGKLIISNQRVAFRSNTKYSGSTIVQTGLGLIGAAQAAFDIPLNDITGVTKRMFMVTVPQIRISTASGHYWDLGIKHGPIYGNREEVIQAIHDAQAQL